MRLGPLNIQAPVLLLGLLAAAIPVLLHLLAKVRAPQVFFPTLRFLRMSMDKTARRRRVQHLLLMLLRMLALAVLAMAVAQPLIQPKRGQFGSDRDTAACVILDNSLSMQVRTAEGPRFDLAKAAITRLLTERNFQEVALIVTNGPPIGEAVLTNPFKLKDKVKLLVCGVGEANLLGAVKQAQGLLATSRLPNKEIYLFTDLQEVSAAPLYALAGGDAKSGAPPLLVITPGSGPRPVAGASGVSKVPNVNNAPVNLAVTAVELDQSSVSAGQPVFLNVTVRNFSALSQKATVGVSLDGLDRAEMQQTINVINPNSSQVVPFCVTFGEPGVHTGFFQVQLDGGKKDDLPADDVRYFTLDIVDHVNVLLVKPRREFDESADGGFWFRRMLSAKILGEPSSPFRLTEVVAADTPDVPASMLRDKQVLVTCDLPDLTLFSSGTEERTDGRPLAFSQPDAKLKPGENASGKSNASGGAAGTDPDPLAPVRRFVRDGGTWMIFLGPSVDLGAYNELLAQKGPGAGGTGRPLLDGRLIRYVGSATGGESGGGTPPAAIQSVDLTHPMFMGFYPSMNYYRHVQVYRYAAVQLNSGSASRAIAELDRGTGQNIRDPLVVETPYGRGRVLLFTTAVSKQWTSWFRQPQGLVIRQMMLGPTVLTDYRENDQVTIGLPAGLPTGNGASGAAVKVDVRRLPDGNWKPAAVEPGGGGTGGQAASGTQQFGGQPASGTQQFGTQAASGAHAASDSGAGPGVARFNATDQLGVYQWRVRGGSMGDLLATGAFAVNVPPAESNLKAMEADRLTELLPDRVVEVGESVEELADKIDQQRKGSPLWPYLLAGVLVLLAVEAKIANRSSSAGRASEPTLRPAFVAGPSRPATAKIASK